MFSQSVWHARPLRVQLLLQIKFFDERVVALLAFAFKIAKMRASIRHHLKQPFSGMLVFRVLFQVPRKFRDALRQK